VPRHFEKHVLERGAPVFGDQRFGRAGIDDLVVVVADFFSMLSQAVGVRLDGIVGYNFLRNFRVVIDYPGEKLRLE